MINRNDVAKLAGVSGATVARAFNSPDSVSRANYCKVMSAAEQLGYHPNYFGRALRGKQSRQLLTYCPDLFNPYYVHVYYGMDDAAQALGYQISLTRHFDEALIFQQRFDGVAFCAYQHASINSWIQNMADANIPYVVSEFEGEGSLNQSQFNIDVSQAGFIAADYLHRLGHKKILYVSDSAIPDAKWRGIQRCAACYSLQATLTTCVHKKEQMENQFECGYDSAFQIARMTDRPSAIIATTDAVAIGVISGLNQQGFDVPRDISVMGVDDILMSSHTVPPLTTVHYPKYHIGYALIEKLCAIIEKKPYEQPNLEATLVIRQSVAPPAHTEI